MTGQEFQSQSVIDYVHENTMYCEHGEKQASVFNSRGNFGSEGVLVVATARPRPVFFGCHIE